VQAVVGQLISTAAARSIHARIVSAVGGRVTPTRIMAISPEALQACGLTWGKVASIRNAAELFRSTRGLNKKLLVADQESIREILLPLKGIGPWTIDMLLMFALGKPDVLPTGDLGIRAAVQTLCGLPALPDAKELTAIAAPWRPYRTVACWYLWRSRGFVPQSGAT